jgi:hypothetical protein
MPLCIIFDADGNEISREQKPKRYIPKGGFYRCVDGNFYKQLTDSFCISDKEEKQRKVLEEALKQNTQAVVEEFNKTHPKNSVKVLMSKGLKSYKEFKKNIIWSSFTKSTDIHTYYKAKFITENFFGIPELNGKNEFAKVMIDFKGCLVKMWETKLENPCPDYVITLSLYVEKNEPDRTDFN